MFQFMCAASVAAISSTEPDLGPDSMTTLLAKLGWPVRAECPIPQNQCRIRTQIDSAVTLPTVNLLTAIQNDGS